jgi:hypothetical protein
MAMKHNGLAKLTEEIGEVGQVAGKMLQYPVLQYHETELHPDGKHLRTELENEIGDVMASFRFVVKKLHLNFEAINKRANEKSKLFSEWDREL